jgi:hypothetical protein
MGMKISGGSLRKELTGNCGANTPELSGVFAPLLFRNRFQILEYLDAGVVLVGDVDTIFPVAEYSGGQLKFAALNSRMSKVEE